MSLIDMEKSKLKEWAKKQDIEWSSFFNESRNSYFSDSEDVDKVYEFEFDNIPQLKKLMEERKKVVRDSQLDTVCAVATFKLRNSIIKSEEDKKANLIPEFIYNF